MDSILQLPGSYPLPQHDTHRNIGDDQEPPVRDSISSKKRSWFADLRSPSSVTSSAAARYYQSSPPLPRRSSLQPIAPLQIVKQNIDIPVIKQPDANVKSDAVQFLEDHLRMWRPEEIQVKMWTLHADKAGSGIDSAPRLWKTCSVWLDGLSNKLAIMNRLGSDVKGTKLCWVFHPDDQLLLSDMNFVTDETSEIVDVVAELGPPAIILNSNTGECWLALLAQDSDQHEFWYGQIRDLIIRAGKFLG